MDVYCECYFFVEDAVEGGEAGGVDGRGEKGFGELGACHGGIGGWRSGYGEVGCTEGNFQKEMKWEWEKDRNAGSLRGGKNKGEEWKA